MNEIPRVNSDVRKELAREAKDLKDNIAFKAVMERLQRHWYAELINSGSDSQKVLELTCRLRVLEAFPRMLNHLMVSETMAQQRGSHGGRR